MKCSICKKPISSLNGLAVHLRHAHKDITIQEYYLTYIKKSPNICKCGNLTKWISLSKGFRKYCSLKCSITYRDENKKQQALEQSNLIKYGVKNIFEDDSIKLKIKSTNNAKYGVNYPQQNILIRKKTIITNNQRYGNDTPLQNDNIKLKQISTNNQRYGGNSPTSCNDIKNKIKVTNHIKYGHKYYKSSEHYKTTFQNYYKMELLKFDIIFIDEYNGIEKLYNIKCKKCNHTFKRVLNKSIITQIKCPNCTNGSSIENKIKQMLIDNNINFIINDRTIISPYELDFYLPDHNLAIECHGLYWHSEQLIKHKNGGNNYHLMKYKRCLNKNVQLLQFYEDEIINKFDIVTSIILSKCNMLKRICTARQCVIKPITNTINDTFLDLNHIQGKNVGTKINLGAYLKNNLIAIMSFKKSQKLTDVIELDRFCTILNGYATGIASKLLKYFITNYNYIKIVSYADKRISNGKLYNTINFKYSYDVDPTYYYVINGQRKHKSGFMKSKLKNRLENFDKKLTEYENMLNHGFDRIWNAGMIKFEWKND